MFAARCGFGVGSCAEALVAYISIQPELIQELVDLVRVRTDQSASRSVPLDISVLAVHCLAALVHTRCVYILECNGRAKWTGWKRGSIGYIG